MIDVDFFKAYNDSLGHVAGDGALRQVAGCIASLLRRPADFAARYGGEEFSVLLPNTGARGAYHVADVMRSAIEALKIPHPKAPGGYVTISIGLATVNARGETDAMEFVASADAALYEAKKSGRNRVEHFDAAPQLAPDTGRMRA